MPVRPGGVDWVRVGWEGDGGGRMEVWNWGLGWSSRWKLGMGVGGWGLSWGFGWELEVGVGDGSWRVGVLG